MPLLFILAGVAIAAAGYGVKKGIDALDADCEADEFIKKAESLKEKAKRKVDNVQSSRNQALVRLGKKKLHVLSHTVSNFLDHFHQLKGHEFVISNIDMQNIQEQVLEALNIVNKYKEMGLLDLANLGGVGIAVGVLATYGACTGINAAAGHGAVSYWWCSCLDEWWGDFFGRWVGCWEYGSGWRLVSSSCTRYFWGY